MNFPTEWSPQAIGLLVAGVAAAFFAILLRSSKDKMEVRDSYGRVVDKYFVPRHRLITRVLGTIALPLLLGGIGVLILGGILQGYLNLTSKILVAHVRAVSVKNPTSNIPMLSADLTLYDQKGNPTSENTYVLNGDEVYIGGDILEYQSWFNLFGFHSGYKVTQLEGMYSDINLEEHEQHTVQVLNGGDDPYFTMAYNHGINAITVTAAYKNGSTVPTNGIGYNICASNDAIVPQPDNEAC